MSPVTNSSLLFQAVGGLFMNDRFSDVTIVCRDVTFKAHRAIICTQSHFFDAALKHGSLESISGTIYLPGDDPETIKRVLCFLYRRTYNANDQDVDPKHKTSGDSDIVTIELDSRKATAYNNLYVYLAADKFGILPLKQIALRKLATWIRDYYMTSSFPEIALQIMKSMPPYETSLLDLLVKVISENLYDLVSKNDILELLRECGQIGSLVITRMVEKGTVVYGYAHYRECGVSFNMTMGDSGIDRCDNCEDQHES